MIRFFSLLIFLSLFSCDPYDYTLDFRNHEMPETFPSDHVSIDSIIRELDHQVQFIESTGLFCRTNKTKYKVGEEIILTLENKTKDETVFIYQTRRDWTGPLFDYDISAIRKTLVSESPAIFGNIGYNTPKANFFYLYFGGLATKTADQFNLTGFDDDLKPGEKMTFRVYPPEKKGFYRFVVCKSDDEGNSTWGLNRFWTSNAFEIE